MKVVDAADGRDLGYLPRTLSGPISTDVNDALVVELHPLSSAKKQPFHRTKMIVSSFTRTLRFTTASPLTVVGHRILRRKTPFLHTLVSCNETMRWEISGALMHV